ncbi:MAG TPA: hypothetical protein VLF71_03810 [Candidatus Saccharimonadales bacterium]|nr:hypothetical protein [Candidatus Saccharimonadales bacterium]
MPHTLKIAASVLATGVALVAYIPYLIDMFRGKNKPHLYTWISIFVVTAIVGYIQVIGGAGVGAVPVLLGIGVDAVILFYCFRFGTKDVVFMDKVCLALSIIGVAAYVVFSKRPVVSLAVVSVAEVISFIPTVRKTRNDPYSESLPSYYLLLVKLSLILIALQHYNWLTVSYPALWITVFVLFLAAVFRWRAVRPAKKHPAAELEDAPLV